MFNTLAHKGKTMTKHEITGFLAFHDIVRWLLHIESINDKAVIHLKKYISGEPLPSEVKVALLQIIDEIQDRGAIE
jgi:hypothetical protein